MIIFGFFTILISSILNNHLLLFSPLFFLCHKYICIWWSNLILNISCYGPDKIRYCGLCRQHVRTYELFFAIWACCTDTSKSVKSSASSYCILHVKHNYSFVTNTFRIFDIRFFLSLLRGSTRCCFGAIRSRQEKLESIILSAVIAWKCHAGLALFTKNRVWSHFHFIKRIAPVVLCIIQIIQWKILFAEMTTCVVKIIMII